jgi:K+-sensing histidine kinase KdpD
MRSLEQRLVTSGVPSRIRAPGSAPGRRAARDQRARRLREEDHVRADLRTEAEAAARTLPVLLSLLSHDLRTPLSVLMIGTHSLGRALAPEHPGRRHLDMLKRNAAELLQMLDNTSEAARIERGSVSLALQRVEVGELVEEALALVRRPAEDRKLTLPVTVAAGVPRVLVSREKLVRVLGDLLARATRVSPKEGAITIDIAPDAGGGARVRIADESAAIPEDHVEVAFELPRDEAVRRLLGPSFVLDLFVARGVVEAHGGHIWLETGAERGNAFVIVLPSGELD